MGVDSDLSPRIGGKITTWHSFLEVLDDFEDIVARYWDTESTPEIPSRLSTLGLQLAAWITDKTAHDPTPMLDVMRAIQAKDPLGHMRAFHLPVDEVDKLLWRWWPIKELLIDQALSEEQPSTTNTAMSAPPAPEFELPVLTIDRDSSRAKYGVHNLKVTPKGAVMLQAIADANGEWVSDWFALGVSKPSEVKNNLPLTLRDLIETKSGAGYRFKRKPREN